MLSANYPGKNSGIFEPISLGSGRNEELETSGPPKRFQKTSPKGRCLEVNSKQLFLAVAHAANAVNAYVIAYSQDLLSIFDTGKKKDILCKSPMVFEKYPQKAPKYGT